VLYVIISRYLLLAWTSAGLSEEWEHSHQDIVTSLRKDDVEGAAAMIQKQIQQAAARVVKFFGH
jgi:DNA-binding GntR family transcriptional regulator